ncbi:hypothetical protein OTU49_002231 [Cherax quadricarinatus]|uniref:Uncharacterized protein n=1 Tax=Cherax quadricarinatus TaxID=27406 RepID=A0AAW0XEN3_CHEQU
MVNMYINKITHAHPVKCPPHLVVKSIWLRSTDLATLQEWQVEGQLECGDGERCIVLHMGLLMCAASAPGVDYLSYGRRVRSSKEHVAERNVKQAARPSIESF